MTPLNTTKTALNAGFLGALVALSSFSPVFAGGFPTFDSTAVGQFVLGNQTQTNQLQKLTEIEKIQRDQLSVLGEFGVMGDLFGGSAFSSIGSEADFYENLKKFAFDPCSINLCQVGDNPVGTTDIEEAMSWAKSNFYAKDALGSEAMRDLQEVRRRAVVYATTNGLALANVVHNELAGAGEEADALEQIVEASESLRGDVRANSAITLATYKIEVQKLAVLTAMLNIEASQAMRTTGVYHEEGGTEFPDAFIDSDYTSGDFSTRTRVTLPEKSGGSPAN